MALPALVLVHGGGMAADSWELTVDEIHRLAPKLTVCAVDLPGRRDKPGDLREMTIAEYVDAGVSKFILRPLGCDDEGSIPRPFAGCARPSACYSSTRAFSRPASARRACAMATTRLSPKSSPSSSNRASAA